ncbi:MAG: hypothetical protein M0Q53_05690 [Prolixibacteraceae bacterium]|jgi:hypothetical protein|nr:hypothetical protein [Prolixibacteraceae bacterium]
MDTEEPLVPKKEKRDTWDKIEIILHPIGGLITALTIALVSYFGSAYLNSRQNNDSKIRLYTELMSSREQSESALRKDMFNSILGTILKDSHSLDENILQLELLAYNFHESLNLMPLFVYLDRQIAAEKNIQLKELYRNRLYKMAGDVISKQISSLEGAATRETMFITFQGDSVKYKPGQSQKFTIDWKDSKVFYDTVRVGNTNNVYKRVVFLKALGYNVDEKRVDVRLDIETSINDKFINMVTQEFTIDYFQFPMIDNTRLSNDMRCSVVMRDFDFPNFVEVDILYFPGSHSSLKEKPYYDEVVKKLLMDQ